jgi:outer membrane protein assembly factor BamD (BamD/ComL family)
MFLKRFIVVGLIVAGLWWYGSSRLSAAAALTWAHKHPGRSPAALLYYAIGWSYYEQAEYPKAQSTLGAFVADFPAGPHTERALLRLADAAEQNRDYAASRDALDRFLADYPDSPERPLASQRRDALNGR